MKNRLIVCLLAISMLFTVPVFSEELYPDMVLLGRTSLLIPEAGKNDYHYTVCYVSADGTLIPTEEVSLEISPLPDGITFNMNNNTAVVYDYAEEGESFLITLTPPASQPKLHIKKYKVNANYNILINGDFSSYPENSGWDIKNSSSFTLKNGVLSFDVKENTNATYLLTQEDKAYIEADVLYECSFDIRTFGSESSFNAPSYYSELIGESAVCYLNNPDYPEWTNIKIPLRSDENGAFLFTLAITPEEAPLYVSIKNLSLKKSSEKPTSIFVSVPQSFSIPKKDFITTPLSIHVLDQEGNEITAGISYTISPPTENIIIENEIITVTKDALPGEYEVTAYLTHKPDISETFSLRITDSGIDNGNFESDQSANSWLASGDGEYSIIKDSRNSYAAFTPNNSVGVMYNNAYVSFKAQQSYVFKSDLKTKYSDSKVFVTFIIEDNEDPENLILCAYFDPDTSWDTYKAVFTPENDINGRFIVATNIPEGSDDQILYLDNIEVVPAIITAEHVKIKGLAVRGNTMIGMFDFVNNFDGESASITNWALAPTMDGPYTTLSYSNVDEIEITEDMEGLYLRFEVTPISLTAGIVGETVYSTPVKVQKKHIDITYQDAESNDSTTPSPSVPETHVPKDNPSFISPIKLTEKGNTEKTFSDTKEHWAEKDIALLSSADVVTGYSDNTFAPEKLVTRAEFCTFLMRSLGLEEGIYRGTYSDVSPQSWYAGVIQTMFNCNLISGVTEKEFAPNSPITREQLITLLVRAYNLIKEDSHVITSNLPFTDIEDISFFALTSVNKAYSLGILSGDSEGKLNPLEAATRAEAITLLTRFLSVI